MGEWVLLGFKVSWCHLTKLREIACFCISCWKVPRPFLDTGFWKNKGPSYFVIGQWSLVVLLCSGLCYLEGPSGSERPAPCLHALSGTSALRWSYISSMGKEERKQVWTKAGSSPSAGEAEARLIPWLRHRLLWPVTGSAKMVPSAILYQAQHVCMGLAARLWGTSWAQVHKTASIYTPSTEYLTDLYSKLRSTETQGI